MSHIARMLTAVVFMLGLVCLTMPGPAAGVDPPCAMVYTYTHVTPDQARTLAEQAANSEVTYDPQTQTATVTVPTNQAGCNGTRHARSYNIGDPYRVPNPPPGSTRSSSSTGSGQTGGSSTHQTTGGGSTAPKGPKTKPPTTQTAPSR